MLVVLLLSLFSGTPNSGPRQNSLPSSPNAAYANLRIIGRPGIDDFEMTIAQLMQCLRTAIYPYDRNVPRQVRLNSPFFSRNIEVSYYVGGKQVVIALRPINQMAFIVEVQTIQGRTETILENLAAMATILGGCRR